MAEPVPIETGLADLLASTARTLGVICRQLIERGYLNEEILIADLAQLHQYLERDGVSSPGLRLPAALAEALRQAPERQP